MWQIFGSAKKSELKKVNFCGRSINFCKNCQMMNRQLNKIFTWHTVATAVSFFEQSQKSFQVFIVCQLFNSAKKSELKKVCFCTCSINFCKTCQNEFSKVGNMELFLFFFSGFFFTKSDTAGPKLDIFEFWFLSWLDNLIHYYYRKGF